MDEEDQENQTHWDGHDEQTESMPTWMLLSLDGFFYTFHTALVLFNTFGWIHKRTRRWNMATQAVTLASWTVLGIWHGFGYCICTDWHWQVRQALGIHDDSHSYIQLLVLKTTGWLPPIDLTTTVTGIVFVVSVLASLSVNAIDLRKSLAAKRYDSNLGRARAA